MSIHLARNGVNTREQNKCHAPLISDYASTSKCTLAHGCDVAFDLYRMYVYISMSIHLYIFQGLISMPIVLCAGHWQSLTISTFCGLLLQNYQVSQLLLLLWCDVVLPSATAWSIVILLIMGIKKSIALTTTAIAVCFALLFICSNKWVLLCRGRFRGFLRFLGTGQVYLSNQNYILHWFAMVQVFTGKYSNKAVNYPNRPVAFCFS